MITPLKVLAHIDRLDQWKQGLKPAPVTVEWDLSNRCYLGCQSCHFAHTHSRGPWVTKDRRLPMAWEGTGDLANTVVVERGLTEMSLVGVKGVVWSGGGEPTLHPDWQQIVRHADRQGLHQGMYTAGGLLTAESAKTLGYFMRWVVVSLDAVDAASYACEKGVPGALFDKACDGIRLLSHTRTKVSASFLLHEKNWNRVEDMAALGRSLGAHHIVFRPTIDTQPDDPATITARRDWITAALPLLEQIARASDVTCDPARFAAYRDWHGRSYRVCHGIKLNTTITPDGRVWVCLQRRGVQGSCVGDLTTEGFAAVWQRHPGSWEQFNDCRAMCRLHLDNEVLAPVFAQYDDVAFV